MAEPDQDDGLSDQAREMRAAQPYLNAAWMFTGGVLVGWLGGYFLDKALHSSPWGLLGLGFLGTGAGFYGFIRELSRMGKKKR